MQPPLWSFAKTLLLILVCALASCATRHNTPATRQSAPTTTVALQATSSDFDVLTQHNDSARTGANLFETQLTPDSITHGQFQRLFHWDVDGQIYGQPLYVSHVAVGARTINLLIVTTMNNSVYAFEAPPAGSYARPSKAPVWHVGKRVLGSPLPYNFLLMDWGILGYNIKPQIGIVSTPVIDRGNNTIYVTAKSGTAGLFGIGRHVRYRLLAIDLPTGKVIKSVAIKARVTGPDGAVARFDATHQMQRPGLLEANGRIYLAFASHQDSKPYHGWLLAYHAVNRNEAPNQWLKPMESYCTTCGHPQLNSCDDASCEGGIWQAGGGPALDRNGNVYVMTGNGSFDKTGTDLSTSFVKLDPALHVLGSWTPPNYECLSQSDSDLGSAGPLVMKWQTGTLDSDLLIGGGKEGLLYAIRADSLNGPQIGDGTPLGLNDLPGDPCAYRESTSAPASQDRSYWAIQAAPLWDGSFIMDLLRLISPTGLAQGFHHIHGAPVLWTPRDAAGVEHSLLYVSAERDLLRSYEFRQGFPGASAPGTAPKAAAESRCPNSPHSGMPGGFLTLSANHNNPESGIIWAAMPRRDLDALNHVVPGVLRAYLAYPDPTGKLVEIWNSDQGPNPPSDGACEDSSATPADELGLFAKFAPPTVSEGKVYMATFSKQLVVYGLKTSERFAPGIAVAKGYDAQLSTPVLPASVKPTEAVAISIVAQNNGTVPWRAGDQVRLASRFIPDLEGQVVEGPRALQLPQDVPPSQSYTFNFHLRAPSEEGFYYYKWQLTEAASEDEQKSETWFGATTPEWRFSVLRPDCADLRQRAAAATAALPAPQADMKIPPGHVDAINAILAESQKRGCRLLPDSMDMNAEGSRMH